MARHPSVDLGPARVRAWLVVPLAALAFAAAGAPAHAAGTVFSPLTTVAGDAAETAVATTPAGGGMVAWTGRDGGVSVRLRLPGIGLFAPAVQVSGDRASGLRAAANDRGDLALAWTHDADPSAPAVRTAVAPAGGAFGSAQTAGGGERPALAVAADGAVTVAFSSGGGAVSAAVRPPGGGFAAPQVLDSRPGAAAVAADGVGVTTVAWSAPGLNAGDPAAIRVAQRVTGQPAFGAARVISDQDAGRVSTAAPPSVVAGFRGDLLVAWAGFAAGSSTTATAPEATFVADRPLGRDWSAVQRVQPAGAPLTPQVVAAVNDRGDAALAGFGGALADLAFRPAGGGFDTVRKTLLDPAPAMTGALAIDAAQTSVHVLREGREPAQGSAGLRVSVIVREAGAPFGRLVRLTPPLAQLSTPVLAADPSRGGLIAWTSGGLAQLVAYGPAPPPLGAAPRVTRITVERRAIRFKIDRAALVRFTVSTRGASRRRVADQVAVARAGVNRVKLDRAVRRVLRRPGRYTVIVRSSSARTKTGRKTHRFRRR